MGVDGDGVEEVVLVLAASNIATIRWTCVWVWVGGGLAISALSEEEDGRSKVKMVAVVDAEMK